MILNWIHFVVYKDLVNPRSQSNLFHYVPFHPQLPLHLLQVSDSELRIFPFFFQSLENPLQVVWFAILYVQKKIYELIKEK